MQSCPKRKGISLSLNKSQKNTKMNNHNECKTIQTSKSTSVSNNSRQLYHPFSCFSRSIKIGDKQFISVRQQNNLKRNVVKTIQQQFVNLNNTPYQGQKSKMKIPSYTSCEISNIPVHSVGSQNKKIMNTNTLRFSQGSDPKVILNNTISFQQNIKVCNRNMAILGQIQDHKLYTRRTSSVIENNIHELFNERKNILNGKKINDHCKVLRDIGNRLDQLIDLTKF